MKSKKILTFGCIGCGAVVLIFAALILGGIGLIGYQGYQFSKEIGNSYQVMIEDYQKLDQEHPFTPPPDGTMIQERVEIFLTVRTQLAAYAKDYFKKIEQQGESIGKRFEEPGFWAKIYGFKNIREIVHTAAKVGAEIGKEHVRLLSQQTMSMTEYRWYTLTYLGTLSKTDANQVIEGEKLWEEYLEKFDSARKTHADFNINFGNHQVNGNNMNQENLMNKLHPVPFSKANAEMIIQTKDRLFLDDNAPTLDFLTLYYVEIIENLSPGTKSPHPPPGKINPEEQDYFIHPTVSQG